MRLATIRTATGHRAVRVDADGRRRDRRRRRPRRCWTAPGLGRARPAAAAGPSHALDALDYAPLVPAPEKIICVGLNYRDHVLEMGNELPEYPTVFAKFAPALVGAHDDIVLPTRVGQGRLGGRAHRRDRRARCGTPTRPAAEAAIAGYTVLNDVSVRDFQHRTKQFLQGKTFEHSTPLGPRLVTPDELPAGGWAIGTTLDGETVQSSTTDRARLRAGRPHRVPVDRSSRSTPATSSPPAPPAASATPASPRAT